jgi:hypothetical protein
MKRKTMTIFVSGLIFLLCIFCTNLFSQVTDLEKTYDIQGKADIDDNFFVNHDASANNYTFTFFIKAKSGKVKTEDYIFDKDFNLVKATEFEMDVKSAQEKYPWWNYNGDKYESEAVYIDEDDDLILKRKNIENTYNWKKLQYTSKLDVKEKLKLKNESGINYFHFRNWWNKSDPDFTYVLCGVSDKKDKYGFCKNFQLLKINKELNIVKKTDIKFEFPQDVASPRFIDKKTETRINSFDNSIIIVFAPIDAGAKISDPNKTNYTYVRINPDLEIIDRVPFTSTSSFWSIEGFLCDDRTDAVYMFGASLKTKDKYYDELKDAKKFDGFQAMKIENHKVGYISEFSIEELEGKIVMPPSQKKASNYEGKRFFIASYLLTKDGKLFVVGQNFFYDAMAAISDGRKEVKYSDCFGVGIDNNGKLLGQYLYDIKGFMGGQTFSVFQFLIPGKNPGNVYWLFVQPTYWNWSMFTGAHTYTSNPVKPGSLDLGKGLAKMNCDFTASYFGKVDLANKSISDFKNYQIDKANKKFYYLCPSMPFMMTDDNKLIFFGTQSISGGKRLWFSRQILE